MTEPTIATSRKSGIWLVEPTASHIRFEIANLWGLAGVTGIFERFEGSLNLEGQGGAGSLEIDAASLNTGSARRDTHLRSEDFFGSDAYPAISFRSSQVTRMTSGVSISGHLRIREADIPLELAVEIEETLDGVVATTHTAISPKAAGLKWNWLGMVRGDATVRIELSLVPARVARFAGQD